MWAWLVSRLGHWVVYFVLSVIVGWGLYAGLIRPVTKPNPTNVQTGGTSYTIRIGFGGCARLPIVPVVKENPLTSVIKEVNDVKAAVVK